MADDKTAADKAAAEKTAAEKKTATAAVPVVPSAAPGDTTTPPASNAAADARAAQTPGNRGAVIANQTPTELRDMLKVEQVSNPITFAGGVGRPFNVNGSGFGTSGVLRLGDRTIQTTSWRDHLVKGVVPPDMEHGPVRGSINGRDFDAVI